MSDRSAILERLRGDGKFLLVTHENPDGDAIGSLVGMHLTLQALGADSVMYQQADEFPPPYEYRNLLDSKDADSGAVVHEAPADLAERTIVYLDCGAFDRMDLDFVRAVRRQQTLINIDHHHSNDNYGDLNLVEDERSSTSEIVFTLVRDLGVELTAPIAEALYAGVVTDTGRFMYTNTAPETHEMAAELLRAGVQVRDAFVRLYEGLSAAKLLLMGRALSSLEQYDDGRLTIVSLTREDFIETGSEESFTEGIIDEARKVQGSLVAAMYRELAEPGPKGRAKVSLRSKDDRINVAAIAETLGGGGHKQAAGATTGSTLEEAVELIRAGIREQLDAG